MQIIIETYRNAYFKKGIFLLLIFLSISMGCKSIDDKNIHQSIETTTSKLFDTLVKIRRDFHQYPELAGNEARTSKFITKYLTDLGLEVKTGVAGNSVIGILKGGKEGKRIAWRADMDALPNNLLDEVSYISKIKGVQHGCGHDVHMAIGLGIAKVLSEHKDALNGTVYFIFQAEEETFVGAKNMVASNEFSNLNLDEIYALHVTALPVGQIMVKPNEMYAYQKGIQMIFNDQFPQANAKILYDKIKQELSRKKGGEHPRKIPKAFDSLVGLSNPSTIFKDYLFFDENVSIKKINNQLRIKAYLYETNRSKASTILQDIEQIIERSEFKNNFIETSYIQENPTVFNDKGLTETAIEVLNTIYGNETVINQYGQIPYFNDDFIYFQQKTPGVYFLLGASNSDKGISAMNHAPNFRVDEESIRIGVTTFSSLIVERLNSK